MSNVMDKYTAAGWSSAQLDYLLHEYASSQHPLFVENFLDCIRPEVVIEMQRMADQLLTPPTATLVKQYEQES